MNWGNKIIVAFICFIGMISTLVYISVNTDFYLVADNYYEQELAYEEQIQRIKNANGLNEQPTLDLNRSEVNAKLAFPVAMVDGINEGTVSFVRASNANLDQSFPIKLDENGIQSFDLKDFTSGAWKIKIEWKSSGREYYKEFNIVI
ncbi:MAG: hypothetical protein COW03_00585 [Cytophagales bacterium CG12_big_fil_rev_8_21_14_0_65_40_12]|nr:MAG: hypothetical protein COW03_00585 [Cytophagales bacterium CG12_big_fil_rev_8_21_14_0_65_40_12]PIW05413.1 MAG: hypothetical protein COW40_04920 [Cytophagales bacterium CG17_big_fil_post_rev_8_21_14_2_50_40_13]